MKEQLIRRLPPEYPFENLTGLAETSIEKIVPVFKIPKAMAYGFFFRNKDEEGIFFQS